MITTEPSPRTVRARRAGVILSAMAVTAGAVYAAVVVGSTAATSDVATDAGRTLVSDTTSTVQPEAEPEPESEPEAEPESEPESATTEVATTAAVGTRFVDLPTTRILDTRAGDGAEPVPPGGSVDAELGDLIPTDEVSTVVFSVNVAMAQGPGPITISAGGDDVNAINAAGPGQMTTNMVFVPYEPGEEVTISTAGGGHLVVDAVGYFAESEVASAGRFVPVATQRIARLVTEVDGREAVVRPLANPALPASGVNSVLVRITADVGGEGGMVRLGDDLDVLPNTMMWAATSGDDRTRQGVAVVTLSDLDELAFTYNGGTVLDLDVLGYFTDESALETSSGLFVPAADAEAANIEINVTAGEPTTIDVAGVVATDGATDGAAIGAVPVNAFATAEAPGELYIYGAAQDTPSSATVGLGAGGPRFGFTVAEIGDDGEIVVVSDVDATVSLVMPGYFVR